MLIHAQIITHRTPPLKPPSADVPSLTMSDRPITLQGQSGPITIRRDQHGIPHIQAEDIVDSHMGLGYCHARDRGLQILLVRTLARGRAAEKLQDTDDLFQLDKFFRRLNLPRGAAQDIAGLSPIARSSVEAYSQGVNLYFKTRRIPWELRVLGFSIKDDPWTPADMIITGKIIGYVGMGQSQAELERFIVECVQTGLPREKLDELFPNQLSGMDERLVKQIKLQETIIPRALWSEPAIPRASASNNWVLSGAKTASGKPMLCNDPHLDIDRIPPVWYEAALSWGNGGNYAIGATMPGCPSLILGRTRHIAWGVTYAFMDCVDSWIEDCRDGKHRVGDNYCDFNTRTEVIRRKKHEPVTITFHENHHGTLEGDPNIPGLYLATRWSCGDGAGAESMNAIFDLLSATTVEQALPVLGHINNSSWSWIAADTDGNIGFQMSGKMPLRPDGISGLIPLPGWDPANDWRGFAPIEDLPRQFNPPEGFIATANDDLNHLGRLKPINSCMGPYRARRIREVLSQTKRFTADDMKQLQMDFLSGQGKQFIEPLGRSAGRLADWDFECRADSTGARLFESFYRALLDEVFGADHAFGTMAWTHILNETSVFMNYFGNFDRILLSERSAWFGSRSRKEIFAAAAKKVVHLEARSYGDDRQIFFRHLLLGKKLPGVFGFDRGPITLPGSRSTVHQGQIHRGPRPHAVAPSIRVIADLAVQTIQTSLPGGVSDRRFSRWYADEIGAWLRGEYKTVSPE